MARNIREIKVFIATPSGLDDVRKKFAETLTEYNESDALRGGVYFRAMGWELTAGGVGRPQSIINEELRRCDYFLLALSNWWGSPTGEYSSGCEEEFAVATECYTQGTMNEIVIFFKAFDAAQLSDPGPQIQAVIDFKQRIKVSKKHLFHEFIDANAFEKLLRRQLPLWMETSRADADSKDEQTTQTLRKLVEAQDRIRELEEKVRASSPANTFQIIKDQSFTIQYTLSNDNKFEGIPPTGAVQVSWSELFRNAGPGMIRGMTNHGVLGSFGHTAARLKAIEAGISGAQNGILTAHCDSETALNIVHLWVGQGLVFLEAPTVPATTGYMTFRSPDVYWKLTSDGFGWLARLNGA